MRSSLLSLDEGDAWGTWRDAPVGEAAKAWKAVHYECTAAEAEAAIAPLHRRPGLARKARRAAEREAPLADAYEGLAAPERERLGDELSRVERRVEGLEADDAERRGWLREHPEASRRLHAIDFELSKAGHQLGVERDVAAGHPRPRPAGLERGLERGMGIRL